MEQSESVYYCHVPTLPRGAKVDIRHNTESGRHLVAGETLQAGDTPFTALPYVYAVQHDKVKSVCHACLKPMKQPLKCSRCKAAWYCGKQCQRLAWKSIHSLLCPLIVQIRPREPTPTILMCVAYLLQRENELASGHHDGPGNGHIGQGKGHVLDTSTEQGTRDPYHTHVDIEAMPTHRSDLTEERKIEYTQMAMLATSMLLAARASTSEMGTDDDNITIASGTNASAHSASRMDSPEFAEVLDLAINFYCRLGCNAHTICDEEFTPIATGLFVVPALLNHSCDPNVICTYEGARLVVRAVRQIQPSEPLVMSYIELATGTFERRVQLRDRYFFHCLCVRCTSHDVDRTAYNEHRYHAILCPQRIGMLQEPCPGVIENIETLAIPEGAACNHCQHPVEEATRQRLKRQRIACVDFIEGANTALNAGDIQDWSIQVMEAVRIQDAILDPLNLERAFTLNNIINTACQHQLYPLARSACHSYVDILREVYHGPSPVLGLQLFLYARLIAYTCGDDVSQLAQVVSVLQEARAILRITHGECSGMVKRLDELMSKSMIELQQYRMYMSQGGKGSAPPSGYGVDISY